MIVSHKYQFVFVHIPKTGGTSITEALRPKLCKRTDILRDDELKHLPAAPIRAGYFNSPDVWWRNYFTFAVMRNPWELIHSDWWFCKHYSPGDTSADDAWHKKLLRASRYKDFAEFAIGEYSLGSPRSIWEGFCCSSNGAELVRFVARYEMLGEDWRRIIRLIGLPGTKLEKRNSYNRPDYRADYTDELAEQVGKCFAKDITRFGYAFDGMK